MAPPQRVMSRSGGLVVDDVALVEVEAKKVQADALAMKLQADEKALRVEYSR